MSGNDIAGSIFGAPQPNQLVQVPYLVTVQFQFKIDAHSKQRAELSIMKGLSIPVLLAPQMISYGVDSQPLTEELLKSMGVDLGKKS